MNVEARHPDEGGGEYRIDELARLAGTTVRNVRAYQDRGLIPPPRRAGRVGLYSEAHLARLRLVASLLERGYTLANIRELITAWESGTDVAELLGLEAAIVAPWSSEEPTVVAAGDLAAMFGAADPAEVLPSIATSIEMGLLEPTTDGFVVRSPVILRAGAELVAAGIPLEAAVQLAVQLRADLDAVAALFVDTVVTNVFDPVGDPIPASEIPRLTEVVRRLRPLAAEAVAAELAVAMERRVQTVLRERLGRLLHETRTQTEAS
ncbi:MAG TPA: MerR family transcriptional regulator [Acidimicrobiales bacterium]|nr:MerR family transcriptional regulator [Acidimicrobiales bacterium]